MIETKVMMILAAVIFMIVLFKTFTIEISPDRIEFEKVKCDEIDKEQCVQFQK